MKIYKAGNTTKEKIVSLFFLNILKTFNNILY